MKILRIVVLIVFFLGLSIGCDGATSIRNKKQEVVNANMQVEIKVMTNLGLALASTGQVARIYFSGPCNRESYWGTLLLPVLKVHPLAKTGGGLESVQEMFRDDPDVVISQDPAGIIRIWIGKLSSPVLDARLPLLRLNNVAQYNANGPGGAIGVMLRTAEAKAAMSRLKVQQAPTTFVGLMQLPLEGLPHLPPSIKNTTIQKALDSVARTFRGVVVYGECTSSQGEKLINAYFVHFHDYKTEQK